MSVAERTPPGSQEPPATSGQGSAVTFVCLSCRAGFDNAAEFRAHVARHDGHAGDLPRPVAGPPSVAGPEALTFSCSSCGATFATRHQLRVHALEHGVTTAREWERPSELAPRVRAVPRELSARPTEAARVVTGPWVAPAEGPLPQVAPVARQTHTLRLAFTGCFAASLALYALGVALRLPNLALAGTLGAVFFGVGAAPLQAARAPGLAVRLGVAGLVGLSTIMLAGAIMVLEPLWHPFLWAAAIAAIAGAAHLAALPRALRDLRRARLNAAAARRLAAPRRERLTVVAAHTPADYRRARPVAAASRRPQGVRRAATAVLTRCTLLTAAGTAMWVWAVLHAGRVTPGVAGFLTHISPLWYAGLALLLAAVILARGKREVYVALAVVSLALATTLTPALVYAMPRAQTAAKHIEIVQYILRNHHVNADAGIYAVYSAFFAGIAWICRVAGVSDSLGLATFWPVIIGLVALAELRFLFGRVAPTIYGCWIGILLVLLVNAIGEDYFSPQSVGFVIGLGVYALVSTSTEPPVLPGWAAALLLWFAGFAVAMTHELSPYIVGGVLIVLAVFGRARPRWAAAAMLVPAVIWLQLNFRVVSGFVSWSGLLHLANFLPPPAATAPELKRQLIVELSSYALLLGELVLIAGALVGFLRNLRHAWAWAFLISSGVGLGLVAFNSYGNEGIYRATLFGIPWLALLAIRAVRRPPSWLGRAALAAIVCTLLGTFLVANFGMDGVNVMRRPDLTALRVFESQSPAGSYLVGVGYGDLPVAPPDFSAGRTVTTFDTLVNPAKLAPGLPNAGDLDAFTAHYESFARATNGTPSGDLYAIWSPILEEYSSEYGMLTPLQADTWRGLMLESNDWKLVWAGDGTLLFRRTARPVLASAGG